MSEATPVLSLVVPCYNEEKSVGYTLPRLVEAFREAGHDVEVIAVDNGSKDGTSEAIAALTEKYPEIRPHRVETNVGYGNGILSGFPLARADWVGMIPADGQVDEVDVVRLFEAADSAEGVVLAKVRRRFRMDGLVRKMVSIAYNLFFRMLWPRLNSLDINGNPKIFPRALLPELDLRSKAWLLDPELMIKAHYLGARVLEFNSFARMRGSGLSHVRFETGWQFFVKLLAFRFGEIGRWRKARKQAGASAAKVSAR